MGRVVGAGQSKGCRTCRRRKVKCDERHPFCVRCEKGNYECEGFTRELRFVDEIARTVKQVKKAKEWPKEKDKSHSTVQAAQSPGCETPTPLASDDGQVVQYDNRGLLLETDGFVGFDLSITRHPPIISDETIHIPFLLAHLLSGIPTASPPWLYLQANETSSSSAQPSICALAAVYFGRQNHSQAAVNRGFKLYGQALKSLNNDLQSSDKDSALSVTVLRSAMTLELYEFIAFSSTSGWLKHAGGVGRLIELRGPSRHQSPDERLLLHGNRVTIALECLMKHKRCFLEKREWKSVPWELDPASKTSLHYIHDILCDIPGLMEDVDVLQNIRLDSEERTYLHQSLSSNILTHLHDLYGWRWTWEQNNPDSCYEVPSLEEHQPHFPMVLYYSNLTLANEINMYNAILLILLRVGSQIIGPSFYTSASTSQPPPFFSENPLYLPGTAPNAQAIAIEICRSVEYHLLDGQNSAGAFFLLFPLRVAFQVFEKDGGAPSEKKWLKGVMEKIADGSGFEIGRGLGESASSLMGDEKAVDSEEDEGI